MHVNNSRACTWELLCFILKSYLSKLLTPEMPERNEHAELPSPGLTLTPLCSPKFHIKSVKSLMLIKPES